MSTTATNRPPTRVIALEEAFLHPKLREQYPVSLVRQLDLIHGRLSDVGPERIRRMDAAGIDLQVLSHTQPGVQTLERDLAIRLSKEVNDWLGAIVQAYPTRFAGFAMLPTQSPKDAADELERTVTQFGFKGALINGHTQGRYLDEDEFSPILERAQALDVPLYIHPTDPPPSVTDTYYRDYPAMAQGWGWHVETGTHLLRLMCGGVFDRYPRLKVIVGHMGELIPYTLDRINMGVTMGSWLLAAQQSSSSSPAPKAMQKSIDSYMRQNVFITTSGVFDHAALTRAIGALGIDRIFFSVDDPFGDNFTAVKFLNEAQLSAQDKEKLAHGNAERVLGLSSAVQAHTHRSQPLFSQASFSISSFKARTKAAMVRKLLSFLVK